MTSSVQELDCKFGSLCKEAGKEAGVVFCSGGCCLTDEAFGQDLVGSVEAL